MVLPLLKLGTFALKTLTKPLATRLKQQATKHPRFRELIIRFAQTNHRVTTQMQRRLYGHATDVEIRPLNEEKAVQDASDLIGEIFLFTVGGAVVVFEVQRSARSEAKKEAVRRQELEGIKQQHDDLGKEVQLLRQELEQLAKQKGVGGIFRFRQSETEKEEKDQK